MASLREGLEAATAAAFCTVSAPLDRTLELGENLYNGLGLPGFPDGPTPLGEGLRAARNVFCNEVPDNIGDPFQIPWTGGQCEGQGYILNYTARRSTGNDDETVDIPGLTFSAPGPITLGRKNIPEPNPVNNLRRATQFINTGNGEVPLIISNPVDGDFVPVAEILNATITTNPGETDDCGNQPEPTPTYNQSLFDVDIDVDYVDNGGTNVTVPVGVVFAPVVINNDLQVEVPIRARFDTDVTINGKINLSTGDTIFDFSDEITLPPPATDPVIVDPTFPPGDPPTEEEEEQRDIIAVIINVSDVGPLGAKREIFSDTAGTNLYGPRLGSVSFHCEGRTVSGLFWTKDIDVKYTKQIVYCPVPWGAKSVVVTPVEGVTLSWASVVAETERSLALRAAGVVAGGV